MPTDKTKNQRALLSNLIRTVNNHNQLYPHNHISIKYYKIYASIYRCVTPKIVNISQITRAISSNGLVIHQNLYLLNKKISYYKSNFLQLDYISDRLVRNDTWLQPDSLSILLGLDNYLYRLIQRAIIVLLEKM